MVRWTLRNEQRIPEFIETQKSRRPQPSQRTGERLEWSG